MFADKMFAVCLYYSKNKAEAEDVLHDGFIKVFQNIHQLKNNNLLEFWIRKIFVNCALARYRKQNFLHYEINLPENEDTLVYNDVIDNISAQEIIDLIQTLSPQYRMVFNLYVMEGYNHKEIAEMLQITESTSKSNLSRARAIMQERLEKEHQYINKAVVMS